MAAQKAELHIFINIIYILYIEYLKHKKYIITIGKVNYKLVYKLIYTKNKKRTYTDRHKKLDQNYNQKDSINIDILMAYID